MIGDTRALKAKAAEEFRLFLLIAGYLAVFFAAFLTYRRLISRELGVGYFRYGFALVEALVVAKVILIGKAIGLGKTRRGGTLAFSTLRLSVLYGALTVVFSFLEHIVEGLFHGKTLGASFEDIASRGLNETLANGLILFVVFIPFFAFLGARKRDGREEAHRPFLPARSAARCVTPADVA